MNSAIAIKQDLVHRKPRTGYALENYSRVNTRKLDKSNEHINFYYEEDYSQQAIHSIINQLNELANLSDNWDGRDSLKPSRITITLAQNFIFNLYNYFQLQQEQWTQPHLSINSEGHVGFEWWLGDKELAIHVSEKDIFYIKAANCILEDMEDGDLLASQVDKTFELFQWLKT